MRSMIHGWLVLGLASSISVFAADEVKVAEKITAEKAECDKAQCDADKKQFTKVEYKVKGLSCGACEQKLGKAFTSIEGVSEQSVCAKSGKAVVQFDPKKVTTCQLTAAIKDSGYKLVGQTAEVKLKGVSCEVGAGKVSKALTSLDGVLENAVCHKSSQAAIVFDPNKVSLAQVLSAIDKTGFEVEK